MYPESFIEELKSQVVISDLVGKKLSLKRRGKEFVACCPFHHEKTASFSVNDIKSFYHCFGCGAHGNIFSFVMETEGLGFKEAVEYIANAYGIALPEVVHKKEGKREEVDEFELIYKINEETCGFFERSFFQVAAKNAQLYARKRGLNRDSVRKFRLGFAPDDFGLLIAYLKSLGFSEADMEKAGVVAKNEKGNYYDKFRNRLMFPVLDKKGRVIAFTGRILGDGMPKYMNSPETKIYKKGDVLFNYFFARKSIYTNNFAVLVEGNMDAISLSINGVENVIAPMGTGITENQISELWKATDSIFVCLDGDNAGKKASERLSRLVLPLISTGKNMQFIFLPKGVDPDDFIRKYGKLEFEKMIATATPLSDYLWTSESESLNIGNEVTPEQKAKLEKNIFKTISSIKDENLKGSFINFYKSKLNNLWKIKLSEKPIDRSQRVLKKLPKENNAPKDFVEKIEKQIVKMLIKNPILVKNLLDEKSIDIFELDFENNECNCILELIANAKNSEELKILLVKNGFNAYIKGDDNIFLNNSCEGSLTGMFALLLEREIKLLEFDLKGFLDMGDIERVKELNDQLIKLREKRGFFYSECNLI